MIKTLATKYIHIASGNDSADALVDYGREMLHAYPYREVPAHWREFYTDAGILKALALGFSAFEDRDHDKENDSGELRVDVDVEPLKVAIAVCDNVLVMAGASSERRRDLVFEMIDYFESVIEDGQDQTEGELEPTAKRQKVSTTPVPISSTIAGEGKIKLGEEPLQEPIPKIQFPIPRVHLPTMEEFQQHVNGDGVEGTSGGPIIITGGFDHWPARDRWTDLDMLCRTAGPDRLVPIEIGSQYTDEQWTQKLVTMREFIQTYILRQEHPGTDDQGKGGTKVKTAGEEIGYLAQHDLFAQIPRLRRDIDIPDYCMVGPHDQEGYSPPDDVLLNAWFGPRGTVSPMHTDPYHNLLAQVVGRKYIRLYGPKETSKLYCYGKESQDEGVGEGEGEGEGGGCGMLGNTSQVNVEEPDLERHPRFAEAEYVETILAPGEMLYIPFQWWHYIRSLSTSFSVSFWF
ncbi:Lysine-specific demethylase 8 [Linnemannia gamsii]|uniref:Lysine-specific demethylase 8 n=1 Tax=Linnemannia gamsii TaxID=64522 RepID=A0ABQ7JYU9_9FUNG|nr:Lysine-specific demethylase 8 [Linnemannia gamsii]